MANAIINSFFTSAGAPAIGLVPTVRIIEVETGSNTVAISNDSMVEVGDGFYKYVFVAHDDQKQYVVRIDGGGSLAASERYQSGKLVTDCDPSAVASAVWEESASSHTTTGSMGELQHAIYNSTVNTQTLVSTLLKYEGNRTRIDGTTNQLIVYENDGTTVFRRFNLFDHNGVPSVAEVCERVPV